ncbi:MAG: tetratricopeptide repeat protein [SAR202 cluster bacterium]|jgi:tetratricopeptide (TPR) repeat protein|nr:tetratricopeptide repeat protein [SAR202 cluster bacterium]MDP6512565.1 tetratricopeptide repeat protein [SAR202 cluster bacterium]MDP6714452.1 tetratricopeptide repeat protein [SAR202 cluster bacterium]
MKLVVASIAVLATAWAIAGAHTAHAQSPSPAEFMESANNLYNTERYQEAAQSYERLVGLGYEDEDLYYNLGNAYYKQDDLGRAILNYMRARRLAPRDEDIEANLTFVQEQTTDALEPIEFGSPLASFAAAIPFASTNTAAGLMLASWAIIAGSCAWWVVKSMPSVKHPATVIAGTGTAFLILSVFLLAGALQANSQYENTTIIIADEVQALSGPGPQYAEEFVLHGGAETELIEVRGNWSRISVPATELQGWVPRHTIEPVVPLAS